MLRRNIILLPLFIWWIAGERTLAQIPFSYGEANTLGIHDTIYIPFEPYPELQTFCTYYSDMVLIRNEKEWNEKMAKPLKDGIGCREIPFFDFSQRSLLGLGLWANYPDDETKIKKIRRIYYVPSIQRIHYDLTIEQQAPHEADVPNLNWVKIPKFPDDIHIEFDANIVVTLSPNYLKHFNPKVEKTVFKSLSRKALEQKLAKADTGKVEIPFLPYPSIGGLGHSYENFDKNLLVVDSDEKYRRLFELEKKSFARNPVLKIKHPDIDFDKFMLVATLLRNKETDPAFGTIKKRFYYDVQTKEIVYELVARPDRSLAASSTIIWVLIPKLSIGNNIKVHIK